ncbi:MFS transporter [Polymorphospora sp. NPDC051019]|uniref:MFS transporter n=1 Tax=Polymorphospora sp. NPDC051019 TaxID=3155725 RepID=UPI003413C904
MTAPGRLLPEGYRTVLSDPGFRRLATAALVSFLGDGLSVVALVWVALTLAPPGTEGLVVGAAVAAYALPAAVGAVLLAPWLSRLDARRLVSLSASLRAVALGTVAVLHLAGGLGVAGYIGLLAVSSVLGAWGNAGLYTIVSRLFDAGRRLPANSLVSTAQQVSIVVGPALAGVLVGFVDAAVVLGLDALTWAFLGVQVLRINLPDTAAASGRPRLSTGFRLLARRPHLAGLLAVTAGFVFLYGPVEVALPLYVTHDLHGSAGLLGAYWAVFGVGAVVGGLLGGMLRTTRQWPLVVAVIAGWGLTLIPFGFLDAAAPTLALFALGGLAYGPFPAFTLALFQNATDPADLPALLAARGAITMTVMPAGAAVGGPLAAVLGAAGTLLVSGVATLALAVVTAAVLVAAVRPARRRVVRA